jgi:hypothetical protein
VRGPRPVSVYSTRASIVTPDPADGPAQARPASTITPPPGRTSRRPSASHSPGGRNARATAASAGASRPAATSSAKSPARRATTRPRNPRVDSATRNSAARAAAGSTSVTRRSSRNSASGMPGRPAPEPTSNSAPDGGTTSSTRSASTIASSLWNKLTPPEREIFDSVYKQAAARAGASIRESEAKLVDWFKQQKKTVVIPDLKAFRKAAIKIHNDPAYGAVWTKELYDRVQAVN